MSTKKNKQPVVSDATLKQMELSTKERIAQEPKVMVIIAPDEKDPMWRGAINGVDYKFPKGEMVYVPEPVAEIIRNSARMQEIKAAREKQLVEHLDLGSL